MPNLKWKIFYVWHFKNKMSSVLILVAFFFIHLDQILNFIYSDPPPLLKFIRSYQIPNFIFSDFPFQNSWDQTTKLKNSRSQVPNFQFKKCPDQPYQVLFYSVSIGTFPIESMNAYNGELMTIMLICWDDNAMLTSALYVNLICLSHFTHV